MSGRLGLLEYQLLNSCADGWEIFYFPFAEVNFGGRLTSGRPRRQATVSGGVVAGGLRALVRARLLACLRVGENLERTEILQPDEREFAVYEDHSCRTFDEHLERFGYGPHEFKTT